MILFTTTDDAVHVFDGGLLYDSQHIASEDKTARRLASGKWNGGVAVRFNNQRRYVNPTTIREAWIRP